MTKEQQPKALQLAEKLRHQVYRGSYDWERVEPLMLKAASELRRLHAEQMCKYSLAKIKDDEALLRQALKAIEQGAWDTLRGRNAAAALRERLGVGKVVGKREHITDGSPCWCNPETTYTDPDTGASVIVHKEPQ